MTFLAHLNSGTKIVIHSTISLLVGLRFLLAIVCFSPSWSGEHPGEPRHPLASPPPQAGAWPIPFFFVVFLNIPQKDVLFKKVWLAKVVYSFFTHIYAPPN